MDVSSDYTQVENVIKQVPFTPLWDMFGCFNNLLLWYERHVLLSVQAQEKLGPVDMLVNCAGTAISGKFEEMEVERFKVSPSKPLLFTWGKN